MKYFPFTICWIIFAILISTSCDLTTNIQDNPPPLNSQTKALDHAAFSYADDDSLVFVPGQYMIVFKDQGGHRISENAALQAVQRTEAIFSELNISQDSLLYKYRYALKGFAAKLTEHQVEALKNDSRVEAVVQDIKFKGIQSSTFSNHTKVSLADTIIFPPPPEPWGVLRVGGPLNGTGKRAWVLDTGINLNLSNFNADISNSASFVPGTTPYDDNGHGTFVAGIIAAKENHGPLYGVAAGAQVASVKVCEHDGWCFTSTVNAGVDYVANNYSTGEVANMSISWPVNTFPPDPQINLALDVLENTIKTAADDGLLFTIAAGNASSHAEEYSPARIIHSNVYTLSAIKENDSFAYTFSCPNPRPGLPWGSNFGIPPVDFAAPGDSVISFSISGSPMVDCGTSYSAPHFAGLLLAAPNAIGIDGYTGFDATGTQHPIAAFKPTLSTPFIFASINNDHPRLGWFAINYAQNYKIYRRIEMGSWNYIGQVSTTTFTDWTQSSPNLSVISSPPSGWSNTLGYKIKAAASGLDDSPFSNTVYFSTDGSCNPCQ